MSEDNNRYKVRIFDEDGKSIFIDVYDVLDAYDVTCPALANIIKKSLKAGGRGHKDFDTDIGEIPQNSKRALQLQRNRVLRNN